MNILKVKPFILFVLFLYLAYFTYNMEFLAVELADYSGFARFGGFLRSSLAEPYHVNFRPVSFVFAIVGIVYLIEGIYQLRKK